ncbi:hypothetical protein EniLVp02_0022 [Vibrio phage EniLVp02]
MSTLHKIIANHECHMNEAKARLKLDIMSGIQQLSERLYDKYLKGHQAVQDLLLRLPQEVVDYMIEQGLKFNDTTVTVSQLQDIIPMVIDFGDRKAKFRDRPTWSDPSNPDNYVIYVRYYCPNESTNSLALPVGWYDVIVKVFELAHKWLGETKLANDRKLAKDVAKFIEAAAVKPDDVQRIMELIKEELESEVE